VNFQNVCIESIVHLLPEEIITSTQIEEKLASVYKKLNLPVGRLEMFSGIKERRFWNKGTRPSDVAAKAALKALDQAGIVSKKIGCLINSSVSRDFIEPATASVVHEKIGLSEDTMIFDISNACLGFVNAMVVVANMIEKGVIKAALVVGGEDARDLVESTIDHLNEDEELTRKSIKKSFSSLTIGSGAAAAVLVHESISKFHHHLIGGSCLVSSKFNNLCQGGNTCNNKDSNKLLMNTDSETLLKSGVELAKKTWEKTKHILNLTNDDIKKFIFHQVGAAHRKLLCETLGIDLTKDFPTFPFLGNMGSVSLPITLSMAIEEGDIKKGDMVALMGIGSGINSMMLGVKW